MSTLSFNVGTKTISVVSEDRPSRESSLFVKVLRLPPKDLDAMITFLADQISFITPKNPKGIANFRILKQALAPYVQGDEWVQKLISPFVKIDEPSNLLNWKNHLVEVGFVEYAKTFDDMIQRAFEASIKIDDLEAIQRVQSTKLFKTPRRTGDRPKILTEIQFTPEISMMVAEALGVKYDVFKMFDADKYRGSVDKLRLRTAVLSTLQEFGFAAVGLEGQKSAKQNTFTKNAIKKFLIEHTDVLVALIRAVGTITVDDEKELTAEAKEGDTLLREYSAKPTPRNLGLVADWISTTLIPNANDLREHEINRSQYDRLKQQTETKYTLDPWQKEMILAIRDGESVLAHTPTSAGKTFTAMSALEALLNTEYEISLAYIAPTADLSLQIFNNIKKTFPNRRISLVAAGASEIVPDTQVWVGTPSELFIYFETVGTTFNVGIFDEVHTISTTFGTGKTSQIRSEALVKLLGMCRDVVDSAGKIVRPRQIVALSATIHGEDIVGLVSTIESLSGVKNTHVITETKRPVPQENFFWNGDANVPLGESSRVDTPVSPTATFAFLRRCVSEQRAPVLVFDESPKMCFNNFTAYLDWVKVEDQTNYKRWYELRTSFEEKIDGLNNDLVEAQSLYSEQLTIGNLERIGERVSGAITKLITRRTQMLNSIKQSIATALLKELTSGEESVMRPFSGEVQQRYLLGLIDQYLAQEDASTVKAQVGETVSVVVLSLLREYAKFASVKTSTQIALESIDTIPEICDTVGDYYRIGEGSTEITNIRKMFNPGKSQGAIKLRLEMLRLCAAERIREEEIRPLFNLIADGLEYGIGIILPTMPFVVRFHMLKLLSLRLLKAVFTSHEMGMGINYPIRTVCIRANTPMAMNVCEYLQMAGRSGRRRLDTIGYVVSWNIQNAENATPEHLPHISIPNVATAKGCQIVNPIDLALEIDIQRSYSVGGSSDMAAAISRLGYSSDQGAISKRSIRSAAYGGTEEGEHEEAPAAMGGEEDEDEKKEREGAEIRIAASGFDDIAMVSALSGCILPLGTAIGLTSRELLEISNRVRAIATGGKEESLRVNAYEWAQKIGLIKAALQELHTRLHLTSHTEWLEYIAAVFELLHRVQLRQMRL